MSSIFVKAVIQTFAVEVVTRNICPFSESGNTKLKVTEVDIYISKFFVFVCVYM